MLDFLKSPGEWCYIIKRIYWCYVSADFEIVNSTSGKGSGKDEKSCISFNNTYSLMVQGNNVSFVVSEYKA